MREINLIKEDERTYMINRCLRYGFNIPYGYGHVNYLQEYQGYYRSFLANIDD